MKTKKLFALCVACLAGATMFLSCTSTGKEAKSAGAENNVNVFESTGYVGIWQKHVEVEVTDDDGNVIPVIQPTNLFKINFPGGDYVLLRATPNGEPRSVDSRIELYGKYQLLGGDKVLEQILVNCAKPELSGISSDVNFSMPDKDRMNVYYSLRNSDGSAGSSEYVPEIWLRVPTSK